MGVFDYKTRTKFGKWIDQRGISQEWIISNVGLNRKTVYRLCNDLNYEPYEETQLKLIGKLRKLTGHDVTLGDFW